MTTANLSVGIDTGPAFAALQTLKTEMAKLADNEFKVNADRAVGAVRLALIEKPFDIKVTATGLGDFKSGIRGVLADVLRDTRSALQKTTKHIAREMRAEIRSALYDPTQAFELGDVSLTIKDVSLSPKAREQMLSIPAALNVNEVDLGATVYRVVNNAFSAAVSNSALEVAAKLNAALNGVNLESEVKLGVNGPYLRGQAAQELAIFNREGHKIKVGVDAKHLSDSVMGVLSGPRGLTADEQERVNKLGREYDKVVAGGLSRPKPGTKRGERYDELLAEGNRMRALADSMVIKPITIPVMFTGEAGLLALAARLQATFDANLITPRVHTAGIPLEIQKVLNTPFDIEISRASIAQQVATGVAAGAELAKSVDGYKELKNIRVKINDTELAADLAKVFATEHIVNINSAALTAQVRAAVAGGLTGGTVVAGVAGAGGTQGTGDVGAALQRLSTSMDLLNGHLGDLGDGKVGGKRTGRPAAGAAALVGDDDGETTGRTAPEGRY